MNRRLLVAVLVGVLVVGGLGAMPIAGQSSADAGNASVTVDDALADAGGEQTVIVRLTDRPTGEVRATATEDQADALQAHAASTQSSFEKFADGNPHVTIDREFWLTNALVVTVDTDRVPLEKLGTVENVERIHEDYEVSVNSTRPRGVSGSATADTGTERLDSNPLASTPTAQIAGELATTQPSSTTGTTATSGTDYTRALEVINVPEVADQGYTGEGVRVAVIDTGVNPNHPDIDITDDNWACFEDCEVNPDGPHDVDGHGTHVSGTIVGGDANDQRLQVGVAPDATLMHAKGLDDDGNGNISSIVGGMEWAVENDADVLSMSLGTEKYDDGFIDPVRNAEESGTVVVASAGNNGADTSTNPGNVYDTIAVGSIDIQPDFPEDRSFSEIEDGTVSNFSGGEGVEKSDFPSPPDNWPNQYTVPDVTAPGSVIWSADTDSSQSTECGDGYSTDLSCMSGTSMAAPHVSGVIALMQSSTNEDLSPDEIKTVLDETAVDIGEDSTRQGAGQIDAEAAVAAVETKPNLTVSNLSTAERITAGNSFDVNYTIENQGDEAGSESVRLLINDTVVETADIGPLNPGEQHSGTFSYQTTAADTGALNVSVSTDKTTRSQRVTVVTPEVRLSEVSITPDTIGNTSNTTHTLSVTAENISDDGQSDEFTMSMPDSVSIQSVDTVTATDTDGNPVVIDAEAVSSTELAYNMSPDTDAELRDVDITIEFTARAN